MSRARIHSACRAVLMLSSMVSFSASSVAWADARVVEIAGSFVPTQLQQDVAEAGGDPASVPANLVKSMTVVVNVAAASFLPARIVYGADSVEKRATDGKGYYSGVKGYTVFGTSEDPMQARLGLYGSRVFFELRAVGSQYSATVTEMGDDQMVVVTYALSGCTVVSDAAAVLTGSIADSARVEISCTGAEIEDI